MRRRLSLLCGALSLVAEIVACAILGKDPEWVEPLRGLTGVPPGRCDGDDLWAGIDARTRASSWRSTVGEA